MLAVLAAPASAAPALHVIPFPGTPDASPLSQVIFSSLKPAELRSVSVTGASSGSHPGRLIALPDGAGTAFVPDAPFAAGERVSVSAALASPAAGTASGDPGAHDARFSFTMAVPADAGLPTPRLRSERAPGWPTGRRARPATAHPELPVGARAPPAGHQRHLQRRATAPGDIFLAPSTIGGSGPMILDGQGPPGVVPPRAGGASNLEVQHYQGQPVLTWWQGNIFRATASTGGRDHEPLLPDREGPARRNGYSADLHEFQLTPQGTALIDAYVPVAGQSEQRRRARRNGTVMDCVIQELDIKTGQVLWEWHALGHVPLSASHATPEPLEPATTTSTSTRSSSCRTATC